MRRFYMLFGLIICCAVMTSAKVHSDSEIGMWWGYGHVEKNHPEIIPDQSRWLGRLYGKFDVLHSRFLTGGILVAWEGYHRWLDLAGIEGISAYTFDGLYLDLMPTMSIIFDKRRTMVISTGAGLSGLCEYSRIKSIVDQEIDKTLGGVAAQFTADLQEKGIGVSFQCRYRFLSGDGTHKYRKFVGPTFFDVEDKFIAKRQMWTLRGELQYSLGLTKVLIGFQAENAVAWNRYQDAWPRWPKDWEYLGYAGLSLIIK